MNSPSAQAHPSEHRGMVLRPARAEDLPVMAEVFLAAWRVGYRGMVPDELIDALDGATAQAELVNGANALDRQTTVLIDAASTVAGFVRYGADHDGPGGYLASLYVHPSASGRGGGRLLLRHAVDAMPGVDVTLWVFEANARARNLYQRAGFRADGARQTEPRWQAAQVRLRRPPTNRARPLPPIPEIELP